MRSYLLATGCQWPARPRAFPPRSTVQGYFYRYRDDGNWNWINARRIKGRKRHIVTDTEGFVIASQVHPANIQDPHGAVPLLGELRRRFTKPTTSSGASPGKPEERPLARLGRRPHYIASATWHTQPARHSANNQAAEAIAYSLNV